MNSVRSFAEEGVEGWDCQSVSFRVVISKCLSGAESSVECAGDRHDSIVGGHPRAMLVCFIGRWGRVHLLPMFSLPVPKV